MSNRNPLPIRPAGHDIKRRAALKSLLAGGLMCAAPHGWPQSPVITPAQTEGPFYPDKLPLDRDNDLVLVSGRKTPAAGEVAHITGRILDLNGQPLRGVTIEIWQCDQNGRYLHSADADTRNDANFQGFGRFETGRDGQYRFRTIKPVPYPGRTPHIHVKLHKGGRELLTTQWYVKDHPLNERDGVLRSIRDRRQREAIMAAFALSKAHEGELAARYDVVLGLTPAE